jgi:hypothetical protein
MSTRIDELPGSIPQDIISDIHNIENNFRLQQEEEILRQNTLKNKKIPSEPEDLNLNNENSNISLNIKKRRVKFEDDDQKETNSQKNFLTFIKDEINEDNLLLLVILIMASRNDIDPFIKMIPFINSYITDSSFTLIITRCLLLLIIYLVLRQYIIPKIKL